MHDDELLTEQFKSSRAHLRAVAVRMLGSSAEADDAVQEAWLRLHRSDTSGVDNLGGWLTTVVGRVCLDMLRSRSSRREVPGGTEDLEPIPASGPGQDPELDAVLADSVGSALITVLESLGPAERIAFVLHDMFDLPFDEIAPIVERSPQAARKLASRARRRVQGAAPESTEIDLTRRRQVVDAFLAASRNGEFGRLVSILHPDVVLEADAVAVSMGSPAEVRGAEGVAGMFSGRAQGAQPALIDGTIGMVWAVGGRPRVVWDLTIREDTIVHIDMIAAPEGLDDLELTVLGE